MKAIPVKVDRSNFSFGGITDRYDELLLIHEEGDIMVDKKNPPENLVKIVRIKFAGHELLHIEPYAHPKKNKGWLRGAATGYSDDERFISISFSPLKIHDRDEPIPPGGRLAVKVEKEK
jgi:hypothetical protein